jgi:hypothetical protein
MKKRTAGAKAAKAAKRRRFVEGLINGKSMRRAALDAGVSQSMANNAGRTILPGVRDDFQQELGRKFPRGKLVQRIAEGLDAKAIKLAQFEGDFTDKRYLVDYSERRRYVELAAKLLGYLVEKLEVTGAEQAPIDFKLPVNFVDPAEAARRKLLDDAEPEADERISGGSRRKETSSLKWTTQNPD